MPYHTFTVGWPDKAVWPNGGRGHHMAVARKVKAYKHEAWGAALFSGVKPTGRAHMHFTFHPKPHGPAPDMDNCVAAMKAVQDGIAAALDMNDREITVSYAMSQERRGCVVVNVSTDDAAVIPLKGTIS